MTQPIVEIRSINLSRDSQQPMHHQLYQALRRKILCGELVSAMRLPASRAMAEMLSVSRNTVVSAYQQLQAEGYLQSRTGAGVFVCQHLPEQWIRADKISPAQPTANKVARRLPTNLAVKHGREVLPANNGSFSVGIPDLAAFPHKTWNRLSQQLPQTSFSSLMGFSDPKGLFALRKVIADYLKSSRSVNCSPEQILITNGAQQALDLSARLLLTPGEQAIIEEPGYLGARHALLSAGAQLKACRVDQNGLQTDLLENLTSENTQLIYCTPTHQYPTGSVMPLERRIELLQWANDHNCWVIEDDYDSEYHYKSRPLASLQGIDQHQRVIYMGSFSKVLFPALRLGYLVLPEDLIDVFTAAKNVQSGETPLHSQKITAEFIQQGHFARHLRKSRQSYAEKLQWMIAESQQFKPWFDISDSGSGMHVVLQLKPDFSNLEFETELSNSLLKQRVFHSRLSSYYFGSVKEYGLVLGFANSSQKEVEKKIKRLAEIVAVLL